MPGPGYQNSGRSLEEQIERCGIVKAGQIPVNSGSHYVVMIGQDQRLLFSQAGEKAPVSAPGRGKMSVHDIEVLL